jgi:FkbM family methyltransferase
VLALKLLDWLGRSPHEAEFDLLPLLCEPGQLALDIGANVGTVSRLLLKAGAQVVAIEPIPKLGRLLRFRFAAALASGKFKVISCVLSERDGEVTLFIPDAATGLASVENVGMEGCGQRIAVPARMLDDLDCGNPAFVKIDVEGHEVAVVAGGLRLLERARPALLIESEERHHFGSLRKLEALLAPLKYEGYFVMDRKLQPIASFDFSLYQDRASITADGTARLPGRHYINNFLFFPTGAPSLVRVRKALA